MKVKIMEFKEWRELNHFDNRGVDDTMVYLDNYAVYFEDGTEHIVMSEEQYEDAKELFVGIDDYYDTIDELKCSCGSILVDRLLYELDCFPISDWDGTDYQVAAWRLRTAVIKASRKEDAE